MASARIADAVLSPMGRPGVGARRIKAAARPSKGSGNGSQVHR
jgi:hypothetical protein